MRKAELVLFIPSNPPSCNTPHGGSSKVERLECDTKPVSQVAGNIPFIQHYFCLPAFLRPFVNIDQRVHKQ